jgi:hypothetical protein
MPDQEYHVKPILFRGGNPGYVPMIVDERGRTVSFALAGGSQTGNDQPRHPTPEEAMAAYNGAQAYAPTTPAGPSAIPSTLPYSDLLRALYPRPSIVMAGIASGE